MAEKLIVKDAVMTRTIDRVAGVTYYPGQRITANDYRVHDYVPKKGSTIEIHISQWRENHYYVDFVRIEEGFAPWHLKQGMSGDESVVALALDHYCPEKKEQVLASLSQLEPQEPKYQGNMELPDYEED